ncbi:hypothetical protein TL16_g10586 [Triparma laevis f. inornata]|uniref:Uncharacterized protein n=1 Tax=Triparma laevis f. inornata TaxID=1714386 RepID=A0A9W7BI09_9STRA|nr:hypothetical protein TL16_g10586 [Triparma laevis f. inornata]
MQVDDPSKARSSLKLVSVGEVAEGLDGWFRDGPYMGADIPHDRLKVLPQALCRPTGQVVTLYKGLYWSDIVGDFGACCLSKRATPPYSFARGENSEFEWIGEDILKMELTNDGGIIGTPPYTLYDHLKDEEDMNQEEWSYDAIEFIFKDNKGDGEYLTKLLSKLAQHCKDHVKRVGPLEFPPEDRD